MTFKYITSILALIIVSLTISLGQNSFEGVIQMKAYNQQNQEEVDITWYVKDGNHRLDYSGTAMDESVSYQLLFLQGTDDMLMLSEVNGSKMKYNIPAASFEKNMPSGFIEGLEKGERSEKIAGTVTRKYVLTADGITTTYWVGESNRLKLSDMPAVFKNRGLLKALEDNNITGAPLKVEKHNGEGQLLMSQEITAINAKPVESGIFEVGERKTAEETLEVK